MVKPSSEFLCTVFVMVVVSITGWLFKDHPAETINIQLWLAIGCYIGSNIVRDEIEEARQRIGEIDG